MRISDWSSDVVLFRSDGDRRGCARLCGACRRGLVRETGGKRLCGRPADTDFSAPRIARGGRGDRGLMLVDSHCHLNYKGLAEQQDAVLTRARARGVTAMLNIATRQSGIGRATV